MGILKYILNMQHIRPELEEGERQALKGADTAKNLFYIMTCIATFNCIIRSDFNFAFGLMGYYMIKTVNIKKIERTAYTLIGVTVSLIIMDVLWIMTMRNVWATKP